jgi:hypothetical protein
VRLQRLLQVDFFLWVSVSVSVWTVRLFDFADMARAPLAASTPSAHDASTGVVDSANIAPLEPEKKIYA